MVVGIMVLCVVFLLVAVLAQQTGGQAPKKDVVGACKVALVIELDDRTHQAGKDQRRDERLQQGGVRTVRFQSKNKPGAQAIREAVSGIAIDRGVTRAPVAA